jgi:hypothetical protein
LEDWLQLQLHSKIEKNQTKPDFKTLGQPDKSKWEIAIQEELSNLWKARTWTIVERPKEKNIVKNKWIFRMKKDTAGKIEQYKVRLVVITLILNEY